MFINTKVFWSLDREAVRRYEELSEIFSDKDNYSQSRELLKEVSFCIQNDKGNVIYSTFSALKTGNQALNDDERAGSVRNLIFYLWCTEAGWVISQH